MKGQKSLRVWEFITWWLASLRRELRAKGKMVTDVLRAKALEVQPQQLCRSTMKSIL